MPFRFTLQAVLRWRESFERREQLRLQMITREMLKARRERDQAKLDRVSAIAEFQSKLREGMNSAEMQFELAGDRARQRRIASMIDRYSKLEDLRLQQLEVFRKAQQQRRILENLRERQLAAYQLHFQAAAATRNGREIPLNASFEIARNPEAFARSRRQDPPGGMRCPNHRTQKGPAFAVFLIECGDTGPATCVE